MHPEDFEWSVELPERHAGAFGGRSPRARVLVMGPGAGESWDVPVAAGRLLAKRKRSGELLPASSHELASAVDDALLSAGKKRVESLVNKRDYSSKEIVSKLVSDGYPREFADELLAWAESLGYVRDARFADVFIRTKVSAGWGRSRIERELQAKGIDAALVPGWPEEYLAEDDERERAFELASRRRLTGKNDFQKIVRYLMGRGYPMSVAYDAAKNALDGTETDV